MMSLKTADYGTVEPVAVESRGSKKAVVTAAVLLVCAALVAISFTTGSNKAANVIDSNMDRARIAIVDGDLTGAYESVCTDDTIRYLIAVFSEDGSSVIPAIAAPATMHWEQDFHHFQQDMDKVMALSDKRVAFSVYNFPVWTSAIDHTSYEIYTTFIDFKGQGMDIKKEFEAATFLGGVRAAGKCASHTINIVESDSYESACQRLDIESSRCTSIRDIQCPFAHIDNHVNPCDDGACEDTEGATFDNREEGYLGEQCCEAINKWCGDHPDTSGCGDYAYNMIYNNHCDLSYVSDEQEKPESILYHPILVEEKRAADEAAAAEQRRIEAEAAAAAAELEAARLAAEAAAAEAAAEEIAPAE